MKKFLCVAASFMMAVSLTACGSKDELSVLSSHFSLRNRLTDPLNIRIQWFIYIFQLQ